MDITRREFAAALTGVAGAATLGRDTLRSSDHRPVPSSPADSSAYAEDRWHRADHGRRAP